MASHTGMYAAIESNRRRSIALLLAGFLLLAVVVVSVGAVMGIDLRMVALFAIPVSSAGAWGTWYHSDRLALMATGAHQITMAQAPELFNLVENMALAAGLPMPAIAIVDDPAPNAFATGRDPAHATIAVTTGLLQLMQRDELQGVIAHEMSHIVNRDTRTMAMVVTVCGSIALICDIAWRVTWYGGGRRSNSNDNNPLLLIIGVIALIFAPIAAMMIQAATSRSRESLADSTAVKLTRNPTGLRKALEKLESNSSVVQARSRATAHLWIESPLDQESAANRMFDTHPPIAERIATLRRMEGAGDGPIPTQAPMQAPIQPPMQAPMPAPAITPTAMTILPQ